ncbi:hypothetical protein [Streptomyces kronopolitis]|uniref:hypothetical protein n=1 Tax=Streptomyces kronopolitis TaxID=1612435 RepID=UPI003D994777
MTGRLHSTGTATPTRYEPTQAETILTRLSPHSTRLHKTDADLQALREAGLASAISHNPRPRIAIYAMVREGQDPAVRLAVARGLAVRNYWPLAQAPAVDFTGMTDPATRPQLARLLASLDRRAITGIVTMSRADVTHLNDYYEETLRRIHARGGFVALATAETDI